MKIKKYITNPLLIFQFLGSKGLLNWIPTKLYLKILYFAKFRRYLNFKNPRDYNEKLQCLKIIDINSNYNQYTDKFTVRDYIKKTIGDDYLVPIYGVYSSVNDINWELLPDSFVLKCTHGSGTNIICKNKNDLNKDKALRKLNKWMNKNWYWYGREYPYKNNTPKIICEKLLVQGNNEELRDYRFFTFNGEPKFIAVDFSITDKSKTRRNIYDLSWNLLNVQISYPNEKNIIVEKPEKLNEMIELSRQLSKGFKHVRIDFYYINNTIYFGEMTFYHQSGFGRIKPQSFAEEIGRYISI